MSSWQFEADMQDAITHLFELQGSDNYDQAKVDDFLKRFSEGISEELASTAYDRPSISGDKVSFSDQAIAFNNAIAASAVYAKATMIRDGNMEGAQSVDKLFAQGSWDRGRELAGTSEIKKYSAQANEGVALFISKQLDALDKISPETIKEMDDNELHSLAETIAMTAKNQINRYDAIGIQNLLFSDNPAQHMETLKSTIENKTNIDGEPISGRLLRQMTHDLENAAEYVEVLKTNGADLSSAAISTEEDTNQLLQKMDTQ